MRLCEFALLTDENVHPGVVEFLRNEGFDVRDVKEDGLFGTPDDVLLRLANDEDRVVVTHDRDFGKMAIASLERFLGILFLRPGHVDAKFSIGTIRSVLDAELEVSPPFIVVAQRTGENVAIRVRQT